MNDIKKPAKSINDLRQAAYRTIRILRLLETGHRSPTQIALKARASSQLVMYYMKLTGIK